jgi:hypothetical protein
MNLTSLIKHLEVNVMEEISAKRATLEAILAQEQSIAANDPSSFEKTVEEIGKLVPRDGHRAAKREHLLRQISEHWQVPVEALTLGSIVRRLGLEGTRLEELRVELRKVVATVLKHNRRLSSLIGMHRRLNRDIIQVVLGGDEKYDIDSSGTILDARA